MKKIAKKFRKHLIKCWDNYETGEIKPKEYASFLVTIAKFADKHNLILLCIRKFYNDRVGNISFSSNNLSIIATASNIDNKGLIQGRIYYQFVYIKI